MDFRYSTLADEILIIEVELGDTGPLVERLTSKNHGYAIRGLDDKVAVIDGRLRQKRWCTPDHMLALEAHECGHILADTDDEPAAERKAIEILEEHGHTAAAQILRGRGVLVE